MRKLSAVKGQLGRKCSSDCACKRHQKSPLAEDIKKKIRESLKGRQLTDEHRQRIREANLGKTYIRSELYRQRMSESKKGKKNPKLSEAKKGKLGHIPTEAQRANLRAAAQEFHTRPEYLERQRAAQTGVVKTITDKRLQANKEHSSRMRELWKTRPESWTTTWSALSPNLLEKRMVEILSPLGWEFVGDGQVWIVGKNPDFIHRKDHKLLEVFGDYWHEKGSEEERIGHFETYGWPCLVVWESEINKGIQDVVEQITTFMKA